VTKILCVWFIHSLYLECIVPACQIFQACILLYIQWFHLCWLGWVIVRLWLLTCPDTDQNCFILAVAHGIECFCLICMSSALELSGIQTRQSPQAHIATTTFFCCHYLITSYSTVSLCSGETLVFPKDFPSYSVNSRVWHAKLLQVPYQIAILDNSCGNFVWYSCIIPFILQCKNTLCFVNVVISVKCSIRQYTEKYWYSISIKTVTNISLLQHKHHEHKLAWHFKFLNICYSILSIVFCMYTQQVDILLLLKSMQELCSYRNESAMYQCCVQHCYVQFWTVICFNIKQINQAFSCAQ